MTTYIAADVQAVADELLAYDQEFDSRLDFARAVLDAVVPGIVARAKVEALREAARDLSRDRQEFRDWKDPRAAVRWVEIGLHARADEIEAGR